MEPIKVQNPPTFSANPQQVLQGQALTLQWSAYAATGFNISTGGNSYYFYAGITSVSWPAWTVPSTTYTITAHGYTAGGPEPSATVNVTVTKPKDKEKEKEVTRKELKDGKEALEPMLSSGSLSPGARSDAGLPSGTQRAFIDPSERPAVGAHLQGGGSIALTD